VFVRSGSTWTKQQELTASDGTGTDNFGYSVALSGDTAVVGAKGRASGQGAAYVFVRSGSTWSQQQELTASDGAAGDLFGLTVAVNGDTAVVGASYRASRQGAAYVFVRAGSTWSQQQELTASDGAANDLFGCSVAVSADTAVVGAYGKASLKGSTYVFTRSGSTWSQQQVLTAMDSAAGDAMGNAVAVNGSTAVVGAYQKASSAGAAYVFALQGSPCVCTASDECHDPGTCQGSTGVCDNPPKPDGATCSNGTCEGGVCTPSSDAGSDSGTGGMGGGTTAATSASSSVAAASSTAGTGGASGSTGSTGGATSAGGTSVQPPEATMASGCRCGTPGTATAPRAAWLAALGVLGLRHRRRRRVASRP
jgi:MYXO-CTERM domain-containing protein